MSNSTSSSGFRDHVAEIRCLIQTAIVSNSAAFGFSIVGTGTLAAISHSSDSPNGWDLLLFGVGGVAAFTILDLLAPGGFPRSAKTVETRKSA